MGLAGSNRRGKSDAHAFPRAAGSRGGGRGGGPRNGKTVVDFNGGVLRATIPSDYAAGRTVQERIMQEVQSNGFAADSLFAVRIALEEALVNAIKHGNALDPHKKVYVEARVSPKRAEIIVEDEGPGFDRTCVPDPTCDENLHKCSGRGILLIEAYMDSEWTRGGRRVRMVKEVK